MPTDSLAVSELVLVSEVFSAEYGGINECERRTCSRSPIDAVLLSSDEDD